jgi:hypothetical protein
VVRTPEGCNGFSDTRSGCEIISDCCPVVCATLRTTGYYLTALQAEPTRARNASLTQSIV